MRWVDPIEWAAARECLGGGHAVEAAPPLVPSAQRDHPGARPLFFGINGRLGAPAAQDVDRGDVLVAWEAIQGAEQCAALQGAAAALKQRIARDRAEFQKNQAWYEQRLQEAKAWAEAGRVHSALHRLDPLTDAPD